MSKTLSEFSTEDLIVEIQRRKNTSLNFTKEDKVLIDKLRKEKDVLCLGVEKTIQIGDAFYDFILTWECDAKCEIDYDGSYKLPHKNPEQRFIASVVSDFLNSSVYEALKLPAVKKAMKEVDDKIAKIIKASDKLAKKYKVNDIEFFETYIL